MESFRKVFFLFSKAFKLHDLSAAAEGVGMKARRGQKWTLSPGERRQVLLYVFLVVVAVLYAFYLGSHPRPHENSRQNSGVSVQPGGD